MDRLKVTKERPFYMKRFLIAAMLLLGSLVVSVPVEAQRLVDCVPVSTYYITSTAFPVYSGATRTLSNTNSDTLSMQLPCAVTSVTFQNNFLKVSGTPAGWATLYGSIDGIGYDTVATYQVAAASTTVPWTKTTIVGPNGANGNPYSYYRWIWVGTGTMSATWMGKVLLRQ